jgi:predicted HAD superfamily Cof-like phosphohydrolase
MNKIQAQVREFHEKFGVKINENPTMPELKERILRANLILEEALEFVDAMGLRVDVVDPLSGYARTSLDVFVKFELKELGPANLVDAADAIADLNYVVAGAAVTMGLDTETLGDEVHRSNMSKVWPDGTVRHRESDGKVLKPPTYSPPNLESIIYPQVCLNANDL